MRLDPSLPHMPGETPASFVSRLARINGLASGRELCKDLGISYNGIVGGDADAATRICELTGCDVGSLLREAKVREGRRYRVHGEVFAISTFLGGSIRFCPICIAEDEKAVRHGIPAYMAPYGRTSWTVAHLRTCHLHGVVLIDLQAHRKGSVQDFATALAPWLQDRRLVSAEVRRSPSRFEDYLQDRLDGRLSGIWLDGMPFYAAARACEMLGLLIAFGTTRSSASMSSVDWACAGKIGFEVAANGPNAVSGELRRTIAAYSGERARPIGPQAWFGRFYQWLEYESSDNAYDSLRDLLARCVADCAPFNPNERMFGKPVPYRRVHSIRSAANETGLESPRLRKALTHAGHIRAGHEGTPDHEVIFDAVGASALLGRLAAAVPLSGVAAVLGVSRAQAGQLARSGHLHALDRRTMGTAHDYYDTEEAVSLLEAMQVGAETVDGIPDGACAIGDIYRLTHCSLDQVVGLIVDRRLQWVGCLSGRNGAASILVHHAEVRALGRRADLTGYTRMQVEQALGIPSRTVNALIEKGLLSTSVQRHPTVPRDILVIGREDLDRFRVRYVRMSEVAEMLGIPLPRVQGALLARGIEPALIRAEFHATFYERPDIETLRSEFDDGPFQTSTGN